MPQPLRILMIEDSEQDVFFILRDLKKYGYEPYCERVQTEQDLQEKLKTGQWDVILSDFRMPKFSGLEALRILNESGVDIPFIIISGNIGEEIAVSAMKAGACDYILKGNLKRLGPALDRELKEAENRRNRRRAEESVRLYMQRLEQSNKELEHFALVASHDLQEPLRKVRMFGEHLKTSQEGRLTEEGEDYLARIQTAVERMQELIDDLLDLSRVNRKGRPFVEVNLADMAETAVSNLQIALKESNGQVEAGKLCVIDADPQQMVQLFQNLIGNSLKFRREDTPPVVKIEASVAGDMCELRISDNGIGFDPQYHERIFNVFERLHGRGRYEGTGIGLAICKKIVERHNGKIWANSAPDEGSTFHVLLPVRQRSVTEPEFALEL